jgi:hypothetical protein
LNHLVVQYDRDVLVTNRNVAPSPPSLEADRMSAVTPQSPETYANVTRENVTLIDGVPTRNGLPVLDEAPSNTDTDDAHEPAEPAHETVLVAFRLPRLRGPAGRRPRPPASICGYLLGHGAACDGPNHHRDQYRFSSAFMTPRPGCQPSRLHGAEALGHLDRLTWPANQPAMSPTRIMNRGLSFDSRVVRFSQIETQSSVAPPQPRLRQHANGHSVCLPAKVIGWFECYLDQPKNTVRSEAHETIGDVHDDS